MNANVENPRLVQVGARVEPELAAAVAQLADAGDRSVSREIRRALRHHVQHSGGVLQPPEELRSSRPGPETSSPRQSSPTMSAEP